MLILYWYVLRIPVAPVVSGPKPGEQEGRGAGGSRYRSGRRGPRRRGVSSLAPLLLLLLLVLRNLYSVLSPHVPAPSLLAALLVSWLGLLVRRSVSATLLDLFLLRTWNSPVLPDSRRAKRCFENQLAALGHRHVVLAQLPIAPTIGAEPVDPFDGRAFPSWREKKKERPKWWGFGLAAFTSTLGGNQPRARPIRGLHPLLFRVAERGRQAVLLAKTGATWSGYFVPGLSRLSLAVMCTSKVLLLQEHVNFGIRFKLPSTECAVSFSVFPFFLLLLFYSHAREHQRTVGVSVESSYGLPSQSCYSAAVGRAKAKLESPSGSTGMQKPLNVCLQEDNDTVPFPCTQTVRQMWPAIQPMPACPNVERMGNIRVLARALVIEIVSKYGVLGRTWTRARTNYW
ncbi:hypothetical protein IF2G_09770 [Cordyceps javanica]|nr:hypothetical protein IF2G_09770 [Cordyceps javanica]